MRVVVVGFALVALAGSLLGCSKGGAARELVQDIAVWSELPDEDAMTAAAGPIRERWLGKRVRWSALATAALCVTPQVDTATPDTPPTQPTKPDAATTTCAMNPFPRGGPDAAAAVSLGGLMPLYRLDARARAALSDRCKGLESCVVDVEGTLSTLTLDPEEVLAVALTDVVVHGGRPLQPGEPWVRAPLVVERPANQPVRPLLLPKTPPSTSPSTKTTVRATPRVF